MKPFIGTKTILAKPMTRAMFNKHMGNGYQEDNEQGYLVEYTDGGKSNHSKHEGYISWSPKEVFERAYQSQPEIIELNPADVITEGMINARGLSARRVSNTELHDSIKKVEIVRHLTGRSVLRFAILTLESGFTVTGRPSVAASIENDDNDVGCKVAIENAVFELWPFLGFKIVNEKHNEGI